MSNGNIKLENLFDGYTIFNIPKYQRTFTWREENIEAFLDDLKNQVNSNKDYFLGTLLFHKKNKRKAYTIIDIVDGQQRLTTAIIFLKVLIEKLQSLKSDITDDEIYKKYVYNGKIYRLELENDDNSFFHSHILENEQKPNIETPSQERLLNAKNYFIAKLEIIPQDKLEKIFNKLISSDIILYVVNDISDATHIFELLNDRGRRLTSLESIKSFLMYKTGNLNVETEQSINDIQGNFTSIYRNIEKYNLNEDEILRFHTIAFEDSKSDDYNTTDKYIKNKINKLFENNEEDEVIKQEILSYIKRLKKTFDIAKELKTNSMNIQELNNLVMIGRVNPFYPLIMWMYDNKNDKLKDFLLHLTVFTFKASLVGLRSNGESDFYTWFRSDRTFELDWIKQPIQGNWWNLNSRADRDLNDKNFFNVINKNIIKYILFSYENYLRENKGHPLLSIENYFSTDPRKKFSIEHISAQKSDTKYTKRFEEKYLHSLGNLVIDTISSNSRKGKKKIGDKNKEYMLAPFMSQAEINNSDTNWNNKKEIEKFIDTRNEKIVTFVRKYLMNNKNSQD